MVKIKDYQSGKAGKAVKRSVEMMCTFDGPLPDDNELRRNLSNYMSQSVPAIMNLTKAIELIDQADVCAAGDRICFCEFEDVPHTISIFLDDLAKGLNECGKAELVSKEKAKELIGKNKKHPIVITRVNGKYQEICRTYPDSCIYWNAEKTGIKCLTGQRKQNPEAKGR